MSVKAASGSIACPRRRRANHNWLDVIIYVVRDEVGQVVGFCWIVLYDPGTGLEGEVAELYVAEGHRGRGIGEMLVRQAVRLFAERRVTLAYVWTRPDNDAAVKLYRSAGFEPNRQLVMTWYPIEPSNHI